MSKNNVKNYPSFLDLKKVMMPETSFLYPKIPLKLYFDSWEPGLCIIYNEPIAKYFICPSSYSEMLKNCKLYLKKTIFDDGYFEIIKKKYGKNLKYNMIYCNVNGVITVINSKNNILDPIMNRRRVVVAYQDSTLIICNVCNNLFGSDASFNAHYYIHSGKWPFVCNDCNMGFAYECSKIDHDCEVFKILFLKLINPNDCDLYCSLLKRFNSDFIVKPHFKLKIERNAYIGDIRNKLEEHYGWLIPKKYFRLYISTLSGVGYSKYSVLCKNDERLKMKINDFNIDEIRYKILYFGKLYSLTL